MAEILSLKNKLDNHSDVLLESLNLCSNEEPDILIVTKDGNKIYTQRLLLCLYSPMMADVLTGILPSVQSAVSLPVSAKALFNLLKVLTTGVVVSEITQDLTDVGEAAKIVGVDFENFQIGVKRKKPVIYEEEEETINDSERVSADITDNSDTIKESCNALASEEQTNTKEIKVKDKTKAEKRQVKTEPTCPECGKVFTSNEKLTRHSLVHTGLKPFECIRCEKAFSRKDKLYEHVKNKHSNL